MGIAVLAFAAPAAGDEPTSLLYPGIGPAGGLAFSINPRVPAGYDSERFLSVTRRSLARWGDTDAGVTDALPLDEQDGRHVIGFAPAASLISGALGQYGGAVAVTQELRPDGMVCTTTHVSTPRTTTVREAYKARVRIPVRRNGKIVRRNGKVVYQVVKKRGKVVRRHGRPVYKRRTVTRRRAREVIVHEVTPVEECRPGPLRLVDVETPDFALLLNEDVAWEFGPDHPDTSENDLESVILHELGHASNLGHSDVRCDTASPMATVRYLGDWWRASDDVSVAECLGMNP